MLNAGSYGSRSRCPGPPRHAVAGLGKAVVDDIGQTLTGEAYYVSHERMSNEQNQPAWSVRRLGEGPPPGSMRSAREWFTAGVGRGAATGKGL